MGKPGRSPQFWRVVIPPGKIALLSVRRGEGWPRHLAITHEFLTRAGEQYVTRGDGMVRFTLDDSEALYGFAHEEGSAIDHYDLIRARAFPSLSLP